MKVSTTIISAFAALAVARPTSQNDKRQLGGLLSGLSGAGGVAGADPVAGLLGGMFIKVVLSKVRF